MIDVLQLFSRSHRSMELLRLVNRINRFWILFTKKWFWEDLASIINNYLITPVSAAPVTQPHFYSFIDYWLPIFFPLEKIETLKFSWIFALCALMCEVRRCNSIKIALHESILNYAQLKTFMAIRLNYVSECPEIGMMPGSLVCYLHLCSTWAS